MYAYILLVFSAFVAPIVSERFSSYSAFQTELLLTMSDPVTEDGAFALPHPIGNIDRVEVEGGATSIQRRARIPTEKGLQYRILETRKSLRVGIITWRKYASSDGNDAL